MFLNLVFHGAEQLGACTWAIQLLSLSLSIYIYTHIYIYIYRFIYIYNIGFRIERPSCRIARPQCRGHVDAIGIHPGSPAWHRRLRRKRAAARARIRSARSTHQEPQVSDLVFLSRHHTRPALRELRHPMGKRGGLGRTAVWPGLWALLVAGCLLRERLVCQRPWKTARERSQGGNTPSQLPILRDDVCPRGQEWARTPGLAGLWKQSGDRGKWGMPGPTPAT